MTEDYWIRRGEQMVEKKPGMHPGFLSARPETGRAESGNQPKFLAAKSQFTR